MNEIDIVKKTGLKVFRVRKSLSKLDQYHIIFLWGECLQLKQPKTLSGIRKATEYYNDTANTNVEIF